MREQTQLSTCNLPVEFRQFSLEGVAGARTLDTYEPITSPIPFAFQKDDEENGLMVYQ